MNVLIDALTNRYGYPRLEATTIDAYVSQQQHPLVLFFSGDPVKVPESNDVAVVLPELLQHFNGRLQAAVITDTNPKLQARYGFSRWPALVFMRGEKYLGTISQIQNWSDYLVEIERILNETSSPLPGFPIPVVNEAGSCSA